MKVILERPEEGIHKVILRCYPENEEEAAMLRRVNSITYGLLPSGGRYDVALGIVDARPEVVPSVPPGMEFPERNDAPLTTGDLEWPGYYSRTE